MKPYIFAIATLLFSCLALQAQSFQNQDDSLWFMQNMPVPPNPNPTFHFRFTGPLLDLEQSYKPEKQEPDNKNWPTDLEGKKTYFEKNPKDSDLALRIFKELSTTSMEEAEPYLQAGIESLINGGIERKDIDDLEKGTDILYNMYGPDKLQEILRLLGTFCQEEPKNAKAWLVYAFRQQDAQDSTGTMQSLGKAMELAPTDPEVLAYALIVLNRHRSERIKIYSHILNDPKAPTSACPPLADYSIFDKALAKHPKSLNLSFAKDLLLLYEKFDLIMRKSGLLLVEGVEQPFRSRVLMDKKTKKIIKQQQKRFLKLLKEPGLKHPYLVHKALMLSYILQMKDKQAEYYYGLCQAAEASKEDPDLQALSATGWYTNKNWEQAIERWRSYMALADNYETHLVLAYMLYSLDRKAEAKRELQNLFQVQQSLDSRALVLYAYMHWQEGKIEEAFAAINHLNSDERFENLKDEHFYFYLALGLLWENNKEPSQEILKNIDKDGLLYKAAAKKYLEKFF